MSRNLSLKSLWRDRDGIILPYVTVLLIVIIGTSALALDGARYVSLQSQLQHGADQLALAAAAELDGVSGADPSCSPCGSGDGTGTGRAENALQTTLASFKQSTLFGTVTDQYVRIQSARFLSQLPASDRTSPIPNSFETENPLLAHFVEVTVTPVTIPTIFPVSFFGGSSFPMRATAVAGFNKNVCQFTPMYICNPYEPLNNADYDLATQLLVANDVADPDAVQHRQDISMRYQPGDFSIPGNYGFLDSPGGGLGSGVVQAIAQVSPEVCINASGVDTQTGFGATAVANAFNVRFDIYQGSMSGNVTKANYAPPLNVRKGYVAATCPQAASSPPQAMALPPDSGSSSIPNIGDGNYDFTAYWGVEHPCNPSCPPKPQVNGAPATNANLPSRYSVYKYEIAQGTNPGGLNDASLGGEVGHPVCSSQVPPVNIDRRIIFGAILNCQALTADGTIKGGKNFNLPVAGFAKFFVIHPVSTAPANNAKIDAEFVGLVPDTEKPFNAPNTVQLYR